jgi:predicted SAM-dependent methyltransferase
MIKSTLKKILLSNNGEVRNFLYEKINKLRTIWINSTAINSIRRYLNSILIKSKYRLKFNDHLLIKLHLGCGNSHKDGFINVDCRKTGATDIVCDMTKLPYPNNSVILIETYHAIEHLPRHDFEKALKAWYRVLKPGGQLVIECPDFDEIVRNYLKGDEKQLDGIFGLQRFDGDYHLFGYNMKRLTGLLKKYGFTDIQEIPPQDYHRKKWPCLRVECLKRDRKGC